MKHNQMKVPVVLNFAMIPDVQYCKLLWPNL
jgi:hypothetical protein